MSMARSLVCWKVQYPAWETLLFHVLGNGYPLECLKFESSWVRDGEGEKSAAISKIPSLDVPRELQMPVEYIGVYV